MNVSSGVSTSASQALGSAKKAGAFSAAAVVVVLLATLWPFNPHPRNGVTWLQGTKGLKIERVGLVVSSGALRIPDQAQSFTLELLVRPANIQSSSTILAFCSSSCSRQLEFLQWKNGLLVTHDANVESDPTGTVRFYVGRLFSPGKLVFVAVASGPNGTTLYVDGQPARVFPRFKISRSDLSGEVVIGTSPVAYHPWSGELGGLAIYAKQLTPQDVLQHYQGWTNVNSHPSSFVDAAVARYSFTETAGAEVHNEVVSEPSLKIPATFSVPHKEFLQSPAQEFRPNRSYAYDAATNIAGFVPLGVVVCSYLAWTRTRWKAILITIALCGALSVSIEILQYYIPRRGSGITDVITNTLGAALGAILLQSNLVRKLLTPIGIMPTTQDAAQRYL